MQAEITPDDFWFRKIVPIGYRVLCLEPLVGCSLSRLLFFRLPVPLSKDNRLSAHSDHLPALFEFGAAEQGEKWFGGKIRAASLNERLGSKREKVSLDCRKVIDVVASGGEKGENVEPGPLVAVSFDVPAAKNRSNKFAGSLALRLRLAPRKNFGPSGFINDERLVATGENSSVDLDIPVLERRPNPLDLLFDGLFDCRKDDPAFVCPERTDFVMTSNKTARFFSRLGHHFTTSRPDGDTCHLGGEGKTQ